MRLVVSRGLDHLRAIGVEMDHGLFAVDVFAGLHGVDGGLLVPVVGGADDDGVDIFAREDLVVVAGGEDVVAPDFLAVREAAVVAVGDGDELDAGDLHRDLGVSLALAAGADQRDLDVVVGGDGFGRFGLGFPQHVGSRSEEGFCGGNGSCGFQKASTVQLSWPPGGGMTSTVNI